MNEKLVKVSTYAKEKGVNVQTVYKWIENGKVESIKIDKMRFIKVK